MQNRPTKEELLRGVLDFLRGEAIEQLEGSAKFHARVAARAVDMVLRELEGERSHLAEEVRGLCLLLGESEGETRGPDRSVAETVIRLNRRLVERIQAGDADRGEFRSALIDHLKRTTLARLEVNNPKMLGTVISEFGL